MRVTSILQGIKASQTPTEKTASAAPAVTAPTGAAPTGMRAALVASIEQAEKVASVVTPATSSHTSPQGDLVKMAADLEAAEKQAALAEAEILGRAFADSAMARFNQAGFDGTKLAAAGVGASTGFSKFAGDNPTLVKQAAQVGYAATRAQLEKEAQDEYALGFREAVDSIHKIAVDEFLKAAAVTQQVIETSRRQAAAGRA